MMRYRLQILSFFLLWLALSCISANAAYCDSTFLSGGRTYFIQGTQPADLATCAYLHLSGTDLTAWNTAVTVNATQATSITNLNNSVNALNTAVTALQTSNTTNVSNIATLRTDVNNLRTDVNLLRTDVNTLAANQTTITTNIGNLNAGFATPFDYTVAGGVFSLFFASTMILWWIAKTAGTVIDAVRKF